MKLAMYSVLIKGGVLISGVVLYTSLKEVSSFQGGSLRGVPRELYYIITLPLSHTHLHCVNHLLITNRLHSFTPTHNTELAQLAHSTMIVVHPSN